MTNGWVIPDKVKELAAEMLLSEEGICPEMVEKLVAHPETDGKLIFSGVELTLVINMDMLIKCKNPPTIRAFLKTCGPKLAALFCCNGLRHLCRRGEEPPKTFSEAWDYFKTFHLEEVNWSPYPVLGAVARSVAQYAAIDLGIDAGVYTRAPNYRLVVKGEKTYESDDIEEFCEAIYKELIK